MRSTDDRIRILVVGLGVQGHKRLSLLDRRATITVDPFVPEADYLSVQAVPCALYDAALVCVPDAEKPAVIEYLVAKGKHVLVEKPLMLATPSSYTELEQRAHQKGIVVYSAYNHRFEPHVVRMAHLLQSGVLGDIYSCRLFYGNGTARLVRTSPWRDAGLGVLSDLGSHLLDLVELWFGKGRVDLEVVSADRFENAALDHVVVVSRNPGPRLTLEVSLCSWRNSFSCDVLAERGSAHIRGLCKWGPSTFDHRVRILPSGAPPTESITLVQTDPTWQAEYQHFCDLISNKSPTCLAADRWIADTLTHMRTTLGFIGPADPPLGDLAQ